MKWRRSCGTRTHAAQGCGNLATCTRCVGVSGTRAVKYQGWEQSGLDGGRSQRAGLIPRGAEKGGEQIARFLPTQLVTPSCVPNAS